MTTNRLLPAATLLLVILGQTLPSRAQPATPPPKAVSTADAARARERFMQGVAFAKKNDWKNAYLAFLEAWKLKQHPQVALNLGRAELETGKYQDASEHLRYCIDQSPAGDPDITLARDWLVQAEKKAAKLTVTVDIDGARILLDDRFVGRSPLAAPLLVDPGSHVVEARRNDQRATRGIVAEMGTPLTVRLSLEPAQGAIPPLGTTPPPETTPAGAPSAPRDGPFPLRTALLIGGGAGTLLGVVVGATASGLSLSKKAERDACLANADRACWDRHEVDRVTQARIAFGGFVGGGLFALAAGATWLFVPAPSRPSVSVAPVVSPTGGGLWVTTQF